MLIIYKKYNRVCSHTRTGADPGFLERGFIYLKGWEGVNIYRYNILISHENEITETKLFHFHRIFKRGWGGEGGSSEISEPPLNPPL